MNVLGLLAFTVAATASTAVAAPENSAGQQVFSQWCSSCHSPGPRQPGTMALAAKYGGEKPAALEMRQDLTAPLVKYFVRHGVSVMPSFRQTEITDADLDALSAYLSHGPSRPDK
jgi:mono/diheme cytochrome c family protein